MRPLGVECLGLGAMRPRGTVPPELSGMKFARPWLRRGGATVLSKEKLLRLQRNLARAERTGDSLSMASGYLVLAGELLRVGDRNLGNLFIERAGECLAWIDTSTHGRD